MLAPNAKLRAQVMPQEPELPELPELPKLPAQAAPPAACEAICAHHPPVRLSWAKLLKRFFQADPTSRAAGSAAPGLRRAEVWRLIALWKQERKR